MVCVATESAVSTPAGLSIPVRFPSLRDQIHGSGISGACAESKNDTGGDENAHARSESADDARHTGQRSANEKQSSGPE